MPSDKPSFDAVERVMRDGLVDLPSDFEQRVLSALPAAPRHARWSRWLGYLSCSGACLGGCCGAVQVLRYVFGIWLASTAG